MLESQLVEQVALDEEKQKQKRGRKLVRAVEVNAIIDCVLAAC